ncbi:tRNA dimethylallyltransferase [Hoeflea marina]|uniref:tRNA dimethylallyltransferase n=1 Tax=Hoeflea marina TaxID=274592 RepID=A0A317PGS8_9HYPH|nr:tRNA (adenosine(37)-N6)-dimethylallyltransferase MiaA [Hoeflea marina]PWV99146.1 tRNA dimethylallyltransferase [Hoeflea marina]
MNTKLRIDGCEAILIAGPTASGKSKLALELAASRNGEIINADSMQVYDVLQVLTARPSEAEMGGVAHHLYGHVPPGAEYSTGAWLAQAERSVADVRARGRLPILVGGTGLYFRAITGGLSDMPTIPPGVRAAWRARLEDDGVEALHAELSRRDPAMGARLKVADRQRILRALEVIDATGKSILAFQGRGAPAVIVPERAERIVILPDRAVLNARIGERFSRMVAGGALEEVRRLMALGLTASSPAMKAIGVSQLREVIEGRWTQAQAIEKATIATRQYAKRQMTWFRNQLDDGWIREAGSV